MRLSIAILASNLYKHEHLQYPWCFQANAIRELAHIACVPKALVNGDGPCFLATSPTAVHTTIFNLAILLASLRDSAVNLLHT